MGTNIPQNKPEAAWPIVVNRQSLLTACWGSKKGADLLWHFLNKTRWEIKNQNLSTSVKVIVFQEERTEIFEAIKKAKAGNSISQGTYNTLLRDFVEVGYVVNQPYSDLFEIHLDTIENAFKNPPQRPIKAGRRPKNTTEFDVNLTHHNTDTISREDYNSLLEVCVNVSKMCQCLSIQVAELTQMCQSLTQNPSSSMALQAVSSATTEPQSNDIEIMLNDNDSKAVSAIAPSPYAPASDLSMFEMLPWLSLDDAMAPTKIMVDSIPEDHPRKEYEQGYRAWTIDLLQQSLVAKGITVSVEYKQQSFAYSHDAPTTDLQENSTETVTPPASVGYTNETKPVNPPEKPKRGTHKPKVEQPVLVDTSKKAVAYNESEQQQFDWYCGCDFIHAKPEQDATKKKHSATLAPFVQSQEEMQDLADFTKRRIKEQFKQDVYIVQMGNMANSDNLNAWIASHKKKIQRTQETEKPATPISLMDEKTRRNMERSKQVLIGKYQERMDKKGKFQKYELEHMVERLGMELPPYLMEQYHALQQVALGQ